MQINQRSTFAKTLKTALLSCSAVLFAALTTTSVQAQKTLEADYPLLSDLNDATANYGPVTLTGRNGPAPSAPANGVCHNGNYHFGAGAGQDIRFPSITTLDETDFEVDLEFKLDALPTNQFPVIMGGNGWRWIGIYVRSTGIVGIKHNNSNHVWSSTTLTTGKWYSAVLKFEQGTVQLHIDGKKVQEDTIGALNVGPGNKNFTTNDYSNGNAFNGCIRNVRFWNDTDLTAGMFTRRATGCGGLTITEGGSPNLGGIVTLANTGPFASGSAFLYGITAANVPLCAQAPCVLGLDVAGILPGPRQSLVIPNQASFVGVCAYFQGITVATGGCLLLTVTDTLQVTVGQ